jgi:hypothetical protein
MQYILHIALHLCGFALSSSVVYRNYTGSAGMALQAVFVIGGQQRLHKIALSK